MSDLEPVLSGFQDELAKEAGVFDQLASVSRRALQSPRVQQVGQALLRAGRVSSVTPADFAKRQAHALTGWVPKGGVQSIGAGAAPAKKQLKELVTSGQARANPSEFKRVRKWVDAATQAEEMGMTSIPGYAKSLVKQPLKTLRTGAAEQWHGGGPVMKSLLFGLPAAQVASEALTPTKPGGPSKGERLGGQLGNLAMMTAPIPIAGQLAAMPALSAAGRRIGRVLSPSTKNLAAPPSFDPAGGAIGPSETIATDRALGTVGNQL